MSAELIRRLNNVVSLGTITESKSSDGLALARVKIGERVTDFLPMLQQSSSFKRCATPIRAGEQVVVLFPQGEGDFGIILGSLFNKGAKEPAGYSEAKEVCEFEDGTVISYDSNAKKLTVNVAANVEVVAQTVNITATTTHTGDVSVAGNLSVDGSISSTGDISTDANVNDVKGSLTNFSTTDGASRA
ncbi:phage baseplate assembly protein V [Sulfurimonas sp. NWX79]|uniref:phage baseplate assembly protein V n=1 Tax=Campylobacterales TaxID=213849 RepID=UPI003204E737|nr:baseplate assembly protein V [Sulfurimonas phage SNW-1]